MRARVLGPAVHSSLDGQCDKEFRRKGGVESTEQVRDLSPADCP